MSQNTMHNLQTLPTTSGQPLTIGARLRYRRAYSPSHLECQWRERIGIGIVTSIDEIDASVRVTLRAETGLHHARFIRLSDGSLQMCASNYLAEILAPAPQKSDDT